MHLGTIIQNYRLSNDMSMDTFSEKSGISKSYINVLEKGVHPDSGEMVHPSIAIIRKAAIGMHMDFNVLFNMLDEDISLKSDKEYSRDNSNNSIESDERGIDDFHSNPLTTTLLHYAQYPIVNRLSDIVSKEKTSEKDILEQMEELNTVFSFIMNDNSMEPRIFCGDIVVSINSHDALSGDIIIATVNGKEVICKKYLKYDNTIILRSLNPIFDDINVTNNPDFQILGIAKELCAKI